ncbi:MAG: hydroxymethylbilane synthase [Lachnospiraceae bacterium]|nr:hydroxymethylbilane synthase [Lachnospiraceae bacterium]
MKKIRVATRKSALALAQTKIVCDRIERAGYEAEIVTVSTRGDKDQSSPLSAIGGDGLFVREIEGLLLRKEADIAVHSAKDLPYELSEGLVIAATPDMADASDVLLSANGCDRPKVVGTSSPRRVEEVKALYPDAVCKDIRGNIDTRLRKLREGQYDAILLAKAGIDRLQPDLRGLLVRTLEPEEMIPAPCQGILAVECRQSDRDITDLLSRIDDENARRRFLMERRIFCECRVDCKSSVGVYAKWRKEAFRLYVTIRGHRTVYEGNAQDAEEVIHRMVQAYQKERT